MTIKKMIVSKTHTYLGHTDCIYEISKIDSHRFVTAGGDGMVVLWDLDNPDQGTLITKLPNSIYSLFFVEDKDLLVVAENNVGIRFLQFEKKTEIANIALPQTTFFCMVREGMRLFVGTHTGEFLVIDLHQFTILNKYKFSENNVRCMALNPYLGELAVGYSDHHLRIFHLDTLEMKYEFKAHDNSVFACQYHSAGKYILSTGRDARIKQWDVLGGYFQTTNIPAHLFAINDLKFNADESLFFTCSLDKSIKVWDTEQMQLLKVIDKARHAGHGTSINKVLWVGERLVSVSDDRKISIWKIGHEDTPPVQ